MTPPVQVAFRALTCQKPAACLRPPRPTAGPPLRRSLSPCRLRSPGDHRTAQGWPGTCPQAPKEPPSSQCPGTCSWGPHTHPGKVSALWMHFQLFRNKNMTFHLSVVQPVYSRPSVRCPDSAPGDASEQNDGDTAPDRPPEGSAAGEGLTASSRRDPQAGPPTSPSHGPAPGQGPQAPALPGLQTAEAPRFTAPCDSADIAQHFHSPRGGKNHPLLANPIPLRCHEALENRVGA